jgi:hypothetical protein
MSGRSRLSSQPKSSVTVLSFLRQRQHRGASRENMRKNQRLWMAASSQRTCSGNRSASI